SWPRHTAGTLGVDGDTEWKPVSPVSAAASEVSGVDEGGAVGGELRHGGVAEAAQGGLEGPRGGREVGGLSCPRHVGVALSIHCYSWAAVGPAAPEVGGVDERRASRVELRHEEVAGAADGRLE